MSARGKFRKGDQALLIDRKDRRYLLTLDHNGAFHSHAGILEHRDIIGKEQGIWLRTSMGHTLLAVKPTLSDQTMHMPRGSQVIYPKDQGIILMMADIFPGSVVVEAGIGSGALTSAMLRAVGSKGRVVTYEVREDMVKGALKNVRSMAPNPSRHTLKMGDIYEGIEETGVDRVVLDVPEPWRAVANAASALAAGGILLCFLPTILQVHRLCEELANDPRFQLVETVETLMRPWNVSGRSVRPAHRMVAHSGFITTARLCSLKQTRPAVVDAETAGSGEEE